jgi:NAD(P)H-quinone oxidoreductase subunit 3
VALLFVIIDVEIIFLYTWAVAFRDQLVVGFIEAMTFIGILAVGFVYAWRKRALEWR